MSSILGYTLTGDLTGTNAFSQNGNNQTNMSYFDMYEISRSKDLATLTVAQLVQNIYTVYKTLIKNQIYLLPLDIFCIRLCWTLRMETS
jgi:hypothetical protein